MSFLQIKNITKNFGGITALDRLNFSINKNELIGLIGPNGAGKTTLFNIISGFYQPTSGQILFKGENLIGKRMDLIAKKRIIRTWQQSSILFHDMTVIENLILSSYTHYKANVKGPMFHKHQSAIKIKEVLKEKSLDILKFMGIDSVKDDKPVNLPHGYQRLLGVGIALAADPELLLLDEPVTGMNPTESLTMMSIIRKIADKGITIILVEHDMKVVMNICEKVIVLNFGKHLTEGKPEEIRKNKDVIKAYLGTRA